MIYSENDLYKAFALFEQGFSFYDVVNHFKKNNSSIYDKEKIELIVDAVLHHYEITEKEFISKSRLRHLVNARGIYYYLSRNLTKNSTVLIGKRVNRDHATVLNGYRVIKDLLHLNLDNVKEDIESITSILNKYINAKNEKKNNLIKEVCKVKS
jgi:chromosomal replication initiation ATPase DnaA